MKPEDYIDENNVPSEEDFLPEKIDEKAQLLKDIKRQCGFNVLGYISLIAIMPLCFFTWHDSIHMIAIIVLCVLGCLFAAFANYQIRRAQSVQEMLRWNNKLSKNSMLYQGWFLMLALIATLDVVLGLKDQSPWYITTLVGTLVLVGILGLKWLTEKYSKDPVGEDIKRLKELENQETQTETVHE